uniref:Ground-like domain-containing protein n=1 Tax=Bursaphelenchus xylophilus TaxID=6326 RepID=A0A1I7RS14_BURXY
MVVFIVPKPIRSIQEHQRRKRSLNDVRCNHSKIRSLIKKIDTQNPRNGIKMLKRDITRHLGLPVNVVCSISEIVFDVSTDTYCQYSVNNLHCLVFLR